MNDVGIKDGAHLKAQRSVRFVHKELPVAPRSFAHIPHFVDLYGMNVNIQTLTLKKQYGNVRRLQLSFLISDIKYHTIQDIIAMRFNYQWTTSACDIAEQAAESGLSARMKMHFWLLQQKPSPFFS